VQPHLFEEGIHEDFMILGHRNTLLTQKIRDQWIEQRSKRGNLAKVSFTIVYIDIEGDAASAKLELKRETLIAIDYIFYTNLMTTGESCQR
jgi:hypothetical protein